MSTLDLHQTIETSEPRTAAERLQTFYEGNGYGLDIVTDQDDTTVLTRGESGSSWWSSNMTELHSRVRLVERDDALELHYEVDVSGQYLTDEDRAFWEREIEAAVQFATGGLDKPTDLRKAETQRADKGFGERISLGIWGAVFIAIFILILGFFGII